MLQAHLSLPPRVDGRKSGKAREKRWCEEPCGEPWKDQRSGDLCQKWRRLLYGWKDETRVFGSWHSLEFRKRFGISRQVFEDLYEATAQQDQFKDKLFGDGRGCPTVPLRQKLAAAIFILTKGVSYQTAATLAGIGTATVQKFFPLWLQWAREDLVPKHVYLPSREHLASIMQDYAQLGFPGACGSTDGVHFGWNKCPHGQKQANIGEKKYPSRVFNITVAHNTEILYVPQNSMPGAKNDKTCAYTHELLMGLYNGTLWADVPYELYDTDGKKFTLRGPYSITDGGYHHWRIMQFPLKYCVPGSADYRQSKRLESVRKDVECTFGRSFKGRFRVLAGKINYPLQELDNMVHVCSMIHNMMLRHDKLDTIGRRDSDWKAPKDDADKPAQYAAASQPPDSPTRVERDPGWNILHKQVAPT